MNNGVNLLDKNTVGDISFDDELDGASFEESDSLNDDLNDDLLDRKPKADNNRDELGDLENLDLGDDGLDMGPEKSLDFKPVRRQSRPVKKVSKDLNDELTNEINAALDV